MCIKLFISKRTEIHIKKEETAFLQAPAEIKFLFLVAVSHSQCHFSVEEAKRGGARQERDISALLFCGPDYQNTGRNPVPPESSVALFSMLISE